MEVLESENMKSVWINGEGDNYFNRNIGNEINYHDTIFEFVYKYTTPENVLDIGCFDGTRLGFICDMFNCNGTGIDVSKQSIETGKFKNKNIKLYQNSCENMKFKQMFDVVIINFVFHWLPRNQLFKCVCNINNSIKTDGFLIIGDFFDEFYKRKYHHLPNKNIYTYKQDYKKMFLTSGLYTLVDSKNEYYDKTNKNRKITSILQKKEIYTLQG